ncbi:MAG: polymerase factor sigma-54 [Anaerocolumna sp.]|nr:polymerase factor sigma-54 [Anaerocolumna sp.]
MRLIDVADLIGIHESTVSRGIKGKYLQCTWGVYPMDYFFSKGIETTKENTIIAAEGVKEEIVRLVEEEDKRNPLSDQKIADILNNKGIKISRRTVAKYRNILEIKDASGRKLFG